ncbi:hypothetical protein R1sor_003683 [Riccia sorocarpa]|uniref:Wings apart-like protein C-terminal domain-containing protein n=1 Tax=Riccia sorocarpa TaxID=122646 RepID=A0ABD3H6D6_9MARC
MIVRTYQRRNRSSRSLSENGDAFGDGVGSSQESIWSEPPPYSFSSSQESCWSQPDHGSSRSRLLSRFSQEEDFGGDALSGFSSRPPLGRTLSERPKKKEEGKPVRSKLRKAQSDLPLFLSGSKNGSSRKRLDLHSKDCPENGGASSSSIWVDAANKGSVWGLSAPPTSTLLEAQESGEMMEHVDEANFAMDGLKLEQPVRVQRASLTSLLSLCGSVHQRRLLRTRGMAKPLIDAIVALPTDDAALSLAAAAVLFFLASDSQDEDLLDSPACVRFLMKLLGTSPSEPVVKKSLTALGSRLAALSKTTLQKSNSVLHLSADRGGAAVVAKIRALFKSSPEHSPGSPLSHEENGMLPGEEINSKWLALLTLEKACLSTVVLEDSNAENVRKIGGQFKERLRELGGLDAICELAAGCLVNLMEALKAKDGEILENVDLVALEKSEKSGGVGLLLRCLRVMENVTFLSEKNQTHLLELKLPKGKAYGGESFIGLTVNVINTLSELYQRQKQTQKRDPMLPSQTNRFIAGKKLTRLSEDKESVSASKDGKQRLDSELSVSRVPSSSWQSEESTQRLEFCGSEKIIASVRTFQRRKSPKLLSSSSQEMEVSETSQAICRVSVDCRVEQSRVTTAVPSVDRGSDRASKTFLKRKVFQTKFEIHQKSASLAEATELSTQTEVGVESKERSARQGVSSHEDSQDPFAFDEFDEIMKAEQKRKPAGFEDSQDPFALDDMEIDLNVKKDGRKKPRRGQPSIPVAQVKKRGSDRTSLEVASLAKAPDAEKATFRPQVEDQSSRSEGVIGDCLLSGVKVLMNLTNNNSVGCQQVAECGGLKALSSLLIAHYPWPKASDLKADDGKQVFQNGDTENEPREADHDLDIVVTVLGVLCNLVEKDTLNRTRLASLKLQVPHNVASTKEGELWQASGMVALLCSLFLTKQGAGEAAAEAENKRMMEMDEDATVKQGQAEAEDMIVEAYTALLLAFLSKESERSRMAIAKQLPDEDLRILVPVLDRFVAFHLQLNMLAPETHAVVRDVIDWCKQPISSRPAT